MMKTLILDTNFLMIPYQHGVDIFGEIERLIPEKHELTVLEGVIKELQSIRDCGSGSDRIAAKVAMELIEKEGIKIIESHGKPDDFILDFATKKGNSIVCTNDKELKRRLRDSSVLVICLRGTNRLELSGQ